MVVTPGYVVTLGLDDMQCPYGSLPTHDGLWRDAEKTSHRCSIELVVVISNATSAVQFE